MIAGLSGSKKKHVQHDHRTIYVDARPELALAFVADQTSTCSACCLQRTGRITFEKRPRNHDASGSQTMAVITDVLSRVIQLLTSINARVESQTLYGCNCHRMYGQNRSERRIPPLDYRAAKVDTKTPVNLTTEQRAVRQDEPSSTGKVYYPSKPTYRTNGASSRSRRSIPRYLWPRPAVHTRERVLVNRAASVDRPASAIVQTTAPAGELLRALNYANATSSADAPGRRTR